jgi:hypothetical protein
VEFNYIDACKVVFRNVRLERSHLIDHFYTAKVNFKIFLDRPDTKQEYVDVFVKVILFLRKKNISNQFFNRILMLYQMMLVMMMNLNKNFINELKI